MPAVHVRNVPEETIARLKARARSTGRSYEAELRVVLAEAATAPIARERRQIVWPTPPAASHPEPFTSADYYPAETDDA